MNIKRTATIPTTYWVAQELMTKMESGKTSLLVIKLKETEDLPEPNITVTVEQVRQNLILTYEGPKFNLMIFDLLKQEGLSTDVIVDLMTIKLPADLEEEAEAFIIRNESDLELLKKFTRGEYNLPDEVKEYPFIVSTGRVETYAHHSLNAKSLTEARAILFEKLRALDKLIMELNTKELG
jgi:GTPase SAR1 family protein